MKNVSIVPELSGRSVRGMLREEEEEEATLIWSNVIVYGGIDLVVAFPTEHATDPDRDRADIALSTTHDDKPVTLAEQRCNNFYEGVKTSTIASVISSHIFPRAARKRF